MAGDAVVAAGVDTTPVELPLGEGYNEDKVERKDIPHVVGGFTLSHVLSEEECRAIIDQVFDDAHMTQAAPVLWRGWSEEGKEEGRRLGQRVIRRGPSSALALFERVKRWLPPLLLDEDGQSWEVASLSERFRLVKYDAGMCFPPHFDGAEKVHDSLHSFLSIVFYLDKGGGLLSLDKDFRGGELIFLEGDMNDLERKTKALHKLVPGSSSFFISL